MQMKNILLDVMRPCTYRAGDYIQSENTANETFHIIMSGVVKKTVNTEVGGEQKLDDMKPLEYFGESGLIYNGEQYACNYVCVSENVETMHLSKANFDLMFPLHLRMKFQKENNMREMKKLGNS